MHFGERDTCNNDKHKKTTKQYSEVVAPPGRCFLPRFLMRSRMTTMRMMRMGTTRRAAMTSETPRSPWSSSLSPTTQLLELSTAWCGCGNAPGRFTGAWCSIGSGGGVIQCSLGWVYVRGGGEGGKGELQ